VRLSEDATFGFALPQLFPDRRVDRELITEAARSAERLGYEALWVQESPIGSVPMPHPLQVMPYVAALTNRVRLGVAVVVLSRHNPAELAWQVAALDQVSDGRVTLGLGIGAPHDNLPGLGMGRDRVVERFIEGVHVMKTLWSEGEEGFVGDIWQVGAERVIPGPLQRPHPPLVFGGGRPAAIRRAVSLGDGWVGAGASSLRDFMEQYPVVQAELELQGRDASRFSIAKRVYVALDENVPRARERLSAALTMIYGDPQLCDRVGVYGGAERCREYLEELVVAGARHVILNPLFDELEHVTAFAELAQLQAENASE
jgi:alkanesulfonate monooxygenase SsuD/methylene tetrahydromethanopterin reductase-like flavin-dependent oxidoreductase (luciferase family)